MVRAAAKLLRENPVAIYFKVKDYSMLEASSRGWAAYVFYRLSFGQI
jgi:hypothetical protein